MVKCPHCKTVDLEVDDIIDSDSGGVEGLIQKVTGFCVQCGRNYLWNEFYKFDHYDNLEETEED